MPAALVVVDDVTFEMNCARRPGNGGEPQRVVFFGVFEELHTVAGNQRRPGRPRTGAGGHGTQGRQNVARRARLRFAFTTDRLGVREHDLRLP